MENPFSFRELSLPTRTPRVHQGHPWFCALEAGISVKIVHFIWLLTIRSQNCCATLRFFTVCVCLGYGRCGINRALNFGRSLYSADNCLFLKVFERLFWCEWWKTFSWIYVVLIRWSPVFFLQWISCDLICLLCTRSVGLELKKPSMRISSEVLLKEK